MKKTNILFLSLVFLSNCAFAQLRTVTADGNWEDPTRWSGGNIATVFTDDVLSAGTYLVMVQSSDFRSVNKILVK